MDVAGEYSSLWFKGCVDVRIRANDGPFVIAAKYCKSLIRVTWEGMVFNLVVSTTYARVMFLNDDHTGGLVGPVNEAHVPRFEYAMSFGCFVQGD